MLTFIAELRNPYPARWTGASTITRQAFKY